MTVSNGQYANETSFNTSFVSREVDTSTVGKLALNNADALSGPSIANPQREINLAMRYLDDSETLNAGATIPINAFSQEQRITLIGDGAPVTLANVLFGAGPFINGQRIKLVGGDATNKCTINNHDAAKGVWLRDSSVTLDLGDNIVLDYHAGLDRFIEEGRNF